MLTERLSTNCQIVLLNSWSLSLKHYLVNMHNCECLKESEECEIYDGECWRINGMKSQVITQVWLQRLVRNNKWLPQPKKVVQEWMEGMGNHPVWDLEYQVMEKGDVRMEWRNEQLPQFEWKGDAWCKNGKYDWAIAPIWILMEIQGGAWCEHEVIAPVNLISLRQSPKACEHDSFWLWCQEF